MAAYWQEDLMTLGDDLKCKGKAGLRFLRGASGSSPKTVIPVGAFPFESGTAGNADGAGDPHHAGRPVNLATLDVMLTNVLIRTCQDGFLPGKVLSGMNTPVDTRFAARQGGS
jgi:hypothetical protein